MIIYLYDSNTKEYTGSLSVDDETTLPANSTTVSLPTINTNETCIFNDTEWNIVPNFKNKTVYFKETGKEFTYDKIGTLPSEFTEIPCPNRDLYSWQDNGWIQDIGKYKHRDRSFRERELNSLQWLIFRHESELRLLENAKIAQTTLTNENIISLDEYFNQWRNFMNETWFIGKQYPIRPEFLGAE